MDYFSVVLLSIVWRALKLSTNRDANLVIDYLDIKFHCISSYSILFFLKEIRLTLHAKHFFNYIHEQEAIWRALGVGGIKHATHYTVFTDSFGNLYSIVDTVFKCLSKRLFSLHYLQEIAMYLSIIFVLYYPTYWCISNI